MRRNSVPTALLLSTSLALPACSVRKIAVNYVGNALAAGGDTYASDDDLELVGAAIPFGLKTIESLLAEAPRHPGLLLSAASGFTQYGFAFVQSEADFVEAKDLKRATELRSRARKLYARARGYGLRGLDVAHPGFTERLRADAASALSDATKADVPLLYWTAAAWGAAISISKDDAELTADQGLAEAMVRRALVLDEGFGFGSLHDFLMSLEGGRPPSAGGSVARARQHLARAIELSKGLRAAPYVSFAESVCVQAQDRKEFEELLGKALAVDVEKAPTQRLANVLAQKRARWLLTRLDDLFIE